MSSPTIKKNNNNSKVQLHLHVVCGITEESFADCVCFTATLWIIGELRRKEKHREIVDVMRNLFKNNITDPE